MEGVVQGRRRRRLGERAWRKMLDRFETAGVTIDEFCRSEGVCRSSFNRWRSQLWVSPGEVNPIQHPGCVQDKAAAFVDLGALGNAGSSASTAGFDLHLDLGGGLTLHLVRR
jgi:hypothetical protein